jgi:folate-dependent phosphoribosylglycinamide formyltransferase PurN
MGKTIAARPKGGRVQRVTTRQPAILLLGTDHDSTWIVYNALAREFPEIRVILEEPVPRLSLIRSRLRRLGITSVIGQILFVLGIRPMLYALSGNRLQDILKAHELNTSAPASSKEMLHVANVNKPQALDYIRQAKPDVVVINGTRILKTETLSAVDAPFINTHQGITPRYRGAHGAYWALYNNDPKQCGVTVHLVDRGIDTGNIIGQSVIEPDSQDNFVTYPYLQMAAAVPILIQAVRDAAAHKLKSRPATGPSGIWYHPGLLQYLSGWLRGVR